MSSVSRTVTIDVHLTPDHLDRALRADVAAGLASTPAELPPKWFYDERGSALFDEITRLDEYYPTRREHEILRREAGHIVSRAGASTVVELGSGTSEKTLCLLDAAHAGGDLRVFAPFDVCEPFLRRAADDIADRYPGLAVQGIVGDFEHHLHHLADLPGGSGRLVLFLGGTIGNLRPEARARFLGDLHDALDPGDQLLLGTDLVKDPTRLVAAYDDARGVTAEFNRNVLRVLARELGAEVDPDAFSHVARWDAEAEWIEMWLSSDRDQVIRVPALDLDVAFPAGSELRTEISAKFRRPRLEEELAEAGWAMTGWWTDADGDFGVSLSTRA